MFLVRLLTFTFALTPMLIVAQSDTLLPNRDFEIIGGKYRPNLEKSEKIRIPPTSEPIQTNPIVFNYDIAQHQANTNRVATPLSPLKYKNREKEDWRGNYFKLGYGNFNMPLAEAYFFNLKDDKLIYGAEIKHLSANRSKSFQDFSQNKVKLYGARILNNNQFTINLAYDRNSLRSYGFDSTDFGFSKKDVLRNYEDWNGGFRFNRLAGKKTAPKIGFLVDYHSFNTSDKSNETSIEGVTDFKMNAFEGQILVDLGVMHTKVTTVNTFQERVFLDLHPRFTFKHPKEPLDITAGFTTTYIPKGRDSGLYIFPDLYAKYYLIKDYVILFGGITGNLDKNLLRTQININHFIADTFFLRNTVTSAKVFMGFEGKLTKNLEFLGEFAYSDMDNLPLYITNNDSVNSFRVIYDRAQILTFKAQLGYTFSTKIRAFLTARVNDYSFETESPWQLPSSEVRFRFQYNIANKIYTTAEAVYWGPRVHKQIGSPANDEMKAFADFNFKFDYRYKKHLSFFVNFNNISSSKIQRWYNYQVYTLNILGGVNFSF